MFRHLLPWHRRLMSEGAEAQAVVVEALDRHGSSLAWKLRMRAHLPGGETREFWCYVDSDDLPGQWPSVGDTFAVRYDDERMDLDLPRIQAVYREHVDDIERRHLAIAEAKLTRETDPHPDTTLTPYVHEALVKLKTQLRDGTITEAEAEVETSKLDGMFDGEITRFLEASEAHERNA